MKLIVIVCDPVVRVVSHYMHLKKEAWHDFVNDSALFNLTDSKRIKRMLYSVGKMRQSWEVLAPGLYFQHIQNWLRYFPLKQFLFINGARLRTEPSIELDKFQYFLNLKPLITNESFVFNSFKGFYCIKKPLNSTKVKCLGNAKGRKHPVIESAILNDLRQFYKRTDKIFFNLMSESPWWPL